MKIKLLGIILLSLLIINLVYAVPSIPNVFSGKVEYSENNGMSLNGYEISASIGSWNLGVVGVVEENNLYEIMIDPQGKTGTISFYIGGIQTEETAEYKMGEFTELDLTIKNYPEITLCGNGIQEPGEQCDNLDLGIGTCENVLGISGAIGNLSCTSYCTFNYVDCSAPVEEEEQTTNTGGNNAGGGGGGGGTPNPTNDDANQNNLSSLENSNNEEILLNKNTQENSLSGITGAVTGFVGTNKITISISVAVILLIIFGILFSIHKKKTKK